jgi:hypothetical protein
MDHDPFVVSTNIARYRALLQTETDETRRRTLRQLIAEFEAKVPHLKADNRARATDTP